LVKTAPRFASAAPLARLIVDHLECPDIGAEYTVGSPALEWPDPSQRQLPHHPVRL
jgi:hypothetical protein